MPNILKQAFATDPNDPKDRHDPVLQKVVIAGSPYLAITFRRLKDPVANGLQYLVDTSNTLEAASWDSTANLFVTQSEDKTHADYDLVTVRLRESLSTQPATFLRIRVERNP